MIDTALCNLAIGHLGIGKEIADAETENSQEARSCRRFYSYALDATFEDFDWPFASKYVSLNLITEHPNDEWQFSYRYPSDCVQMRKILSGLRNDTHQTRVPFGVAQDAGGRIILTDINNAKALYTMRDEDSMNYSASFKIAFSYRLAFYICPTITSGDYSGIQDKVFQLYNMELANARANAVNEPQADQEVDSEFIRVR